MDIGAADIIGGGIVIGTITVDGPAADGVTVVNVHITEAAAGTDAGADNGIDPLK